MATEQDYIVLPVSALKDQVTAVFDALKADKTVYVSNHGRIAAAFRPHAFVPEGVAAIHVSPHLAMPFTISARDMGRGVPSKRLREAAAGLPSIVEKDRNIYGMLTPATAPPPRAIPDPATVGAKAEALLEYQTDNPSASDDDLIAFADRQGFAHEQESESAPWPFADPQSGVAQFDDDDEALTSDLADWRARGSDVEDFVEAALDRLVTLSPVGLEDGPSGHTRIDVLLGEREEAAGNLVAARARYVAGLIADGHPNVAVMWRLGNLARAVEHQAEAARWFRLSLAYDHLSVTRPIITFGRPASSTPIPSATLAETTVYR